MTKKRSTKRALLMSALSLLLCISMFVGSTYAWFTDEVISTGNKIEAGTLKIDMLVRNAETGKYDSVKKSQKAIFDYDLWEPGYTEAVNVKVANLGTLALQYNLQIVTEGLVQELLDQEVMLSDAIDVYYASEEVLMADRAAFTDAIANGELKLVGTLTDVIFGGAMIRDTLLAGESDFATIVLKMRETAGNEYQGLSVGTKFDLKLFATQYTYEKDSFDNQYDKIELPAATLMVMEPKLLETYLLDAGCVYMTTETWNDAWGYDYVADAPTAGTPEYAYYFADFVVSFDKDHAAGEVGLWGYYASWGVEESFKMDAIEAGKDYRIIPLAEEKLNIAMGSISYQQLLNEVGAFACGVTEGSLKDGETITVTLRMYETKLNGANSFSETGAYHDIAVYTYTAGNPKV